ncbi:MAG: DUF4900 domain-containing protein [Candidatus Omnitrophota bacterium]
MFRNKRGISLILIFLVIVVLLILGAAFILRTVAENYAARKEKNSIQAFFLGEAGANAGLNRIDLLINIDMMDTVNSANPNVLVKHLTKNPDYVGNEDGIGFLIAYTKEAGLEQFVPSGESAIYTEIPAALGNGTYEYTITVTENGDPVEVGTDAWDFPYNYVIAGTGDVQNTRRTVLLSGDFTVQVQRDNFARYALFTDHHTLESGTKVWFTDKTHFYGPVHTNELFSFALNPSGTFDDLVTQHLDKARFYNDWSWILADWDYNNEETGELIDVPIFNAGYNRGVDPVNLESSVQKEDLIYQAWGEPSTPPLGIYVPNDGSNLTAGIYVRGDCTIDMGVDLSGNATYTITRGATTNIITVDYDNTQTTVEVVGGSTDTYNGLPDGVDDVGNIIYVDGEVSSFAGTVQSQSQITVSSENDIIIQDNILYEEYTPAIGNPGDAGYVPPNAEGYTNLLGILSWGGDVRIGTSAPDDINIRGTVMARNGIFTVDDYNLDLPRGTATLLGGTITQFYGAFGMFNGSSGEQIHGYGRNFIYDGRMGAGESPPYFPSMRTFIAFTNDITDRITWQEGESQ